jgi:hypothetical protein
MRWIVLFLFEVISVGVTKLALDVQFGTRSFKIRFFGHQTCHLVQVRSFRSNACISTANVACAGPLSATNAILVRRARGF